MRSKDPKLMEMIGRFAGDYYRQNRRTPTTREIAAEVGVSAACAYNYLVEMDRRGMLSYENGRIAGLSRMEKARTGYFSAPLVGSINCGDPETEEEQVEMYVSLPEAIFGTGRFYLLRASGDSMEDAGISDGDLILIDRVPACEPGDIVVAMNEDGENTLKRYGGVDPETRRAVLEYANERVYPGKRILVRELILQGVARKVIRDL